MTPIWVRWIDSNAQHGWSSAEDMTTLRPAHSLHIGFLVYEDDDCVILSPTVRGREQDGHNPYHSPVAIPKFAIYERGEIELK